MLCEPTDPLTCGGAWVSLEFRGQCLVPRMPFVRPGLLQTAGVALCLLLLLSRQREAQCRAPKFSLRPHQLHCTFPDLRGSHNLKLAMSRQHLIHFRCCKLHGSLKPHHPKRRRLHEVLTSHPHTISLYGLPETVNIVARI